MEIAAVVFLTLGWCFFAAGFKKFWQVVLVLAVGLSIITLLLLQ